MKLIHNIFKPIKHARLAICKLTCNAKLKKYFKIALPTILLILICIIGGFILYEIEHSYGVPPIDPFLRNNTEECLANGGYWSALIFVNGISTADSEYNLPVRGSGWGRALTVLLTLTGIPMALIVLEQVGTVLARLCSHCYVCLYMVYTNRIKHILPVRNTTLQPQISEPNNQPLTEEQIITPLWFVGIICVCWVLFCGMVYTVRNDWNFGDGSFFSFSVLTIGTLRDVTAMGYGIAIFTMLSVFVGLALVSNVISTIQENIDRTVSRVEDILDEEIKQAIANQTPISEIEDILRLIGAPAYVISMIPKKQLENLAKQKEKGSGLVTSGSQTDAATKEPTTSPPSIQLASTQDECVGACTELNDQQCMAQPTTRTTRTQTEPNRTLEASQRYFEASLWGVMGN